MNEDTATAAAAGLGVGVGLFYLAILILVIVSVWKIFTKAGQPGWASIVPFYNWYVLFQIAGKPGWWLVFIIIPPVFLIFQIIALVGLAQNFGKGGGFAVGLIFLAIIFLPILAFGSAQYQARPAAA